MILPDASWQSRTGMAKLLRALGAGRGETRFVGGCVRDALLGIDASDVDLATRLEPGEVIARLEAARIKAVPTGIAHGTVTAVLDGKPIEVTTLRRDIATDGRRATIAYTEDWREDAARRDFTINAMSADPKTRTVHDYFGGLDDVAARRVRFIGDPLQRIAEDHLRILRFFRFHARFGGGAPDPAGLEACAARANDLMALSRERIADEILKLLALPEPTRTIALMIDRGIFQPVLPEIASVGRLEPLAQRERAAAVDPDPIRRLSALLPRQPGTAVDIAGRLRLSNAARHRLGCIEAGGDLPDDARVLAYYFGLACAIDRLLLDAGLDAGEAARRVATLAGWKRPRLPLGGGHLITLGLKPGPAVAATMRAIEREWTEAGFSWSRAEARAVARRQVDQALRVSQ